MEGGLEGETTATWSQRVVGAINNTMKCSDIQKRKDTAAKKEIHRLQFRQLAKAEIALHNNWADNQARRELSNAQ